MPRSAILAMAAVLAVGIGPVFAGSSAAAGPPTAPCIQVSGVCKPYPNCWRSPNDETCAWARHDAEDPQEYARDKTDMIRLIGGRGYGNLHLFVEFSRGPEGLTLMQLRKIGSDARAVTVPVSDADWIEVRARAAAFVKADAAQRAQNDEDDRRPDSDTIICMDGINASLEIVDAGKAFYYPVDSCRNPPVREFIGYIEARVHALVPGCEKLTPYAVGFCLGLSGDRFAAAEIANSASDVFWSDCEKDAPTQAALDRHFASGARFDVAGETPQRGGKAVSARWIASKCGNPAWQVYTSDILAQGNSGVVTGTVDIRDDSEVCPGQNAITRWSRLFRQHWRRDAKGAFRIADWRFGPAVLTSQYTPKCGAAASVWSLTRAVQDAVLR